MTEVVNHDESAPTGRTLAEVGAGLDMPLREAMETQRAIRRLLPDPVDDDVIRRCIELALKAPTGSNGQNWEFVVVKDAETKAAFAKQYRKIWKIYGGIGRRVTRNDPPMRRILDAVEWQIDHFEEVPVVVVACLRGWRAPGLPMPAIGASSYYGSIYPSVQNLLLAARAMGLGAALITLPLYNVRKARRLLGLPISVMPCAMVPMGWPRGRYGPTTRKPVDTVLHLDRYGTPFPST
ncbi:MAG TPA: nitroreductase family protein [Acidimicrobiia bacterium]|nr:nitroreductase family protein [Acidimicrobiia bacterium]